MATATPFLVICNFFWMALEGPMNSKLTGFFLSISCSCFFASRFCSTFAVFLAIGSPMVGMSSILEIVILFGPGSSSLTKDSSVKGCKSAKTFLLDVHLLVLSWIMSLASSSFFFRLSSV